MIKNSILLVLIESRVAASTPSAANTTHLTFAEEFAVADHMEDVDGQDASGESNLCLSGRDDYLENVFVLPVGDLHVGIHAAVIVLPLFQQVHLGHNASKVDAHKDNHGDTTS